MTAPTPVKVLEAAIAKAIERSTGVPRIWVGFSGGLDSTVLLHLLAAAAVERISVVHVDHGLHPRSADWARHCAAVACSLDVPFQQRRVGVEPGSNLEARARAARYQVFESVLGVGDVLMLAHHADDQLETILLRLLRGTDGNRIAMADERPLGRGRILRPFLDVPRDQIRVAARALSLAWVEDPANASLDLDRSYLRHTVLPAVRARWPAAAHAAAQGAARAALDAMIAASALDAAIGEPGSPLPIDRLVDRAASRLLRRWLAHQGIAHVRESAIVEVLTQVERGHRVGVEVAAGVFVRRHRDRLLVTTARPTHFEPKSWDLSAPVELPVGVLRVQARAEAPAVSVQIVPWRRGGRMIVPDRSGSRSVARLLQEADVPAWRRVDYPLLFVAGALAVVPGVAVAAEFADLFETGTVTARRDLWRIEYDAK